MLFRQFFDITIYIRVVVKMAEQHINVSSFSNPGHKVRILVESRGRICPVVFHLFRTLSPGLRITIHRNVSLIFNFPTTLIYMVMLENCRNNISMYGCSPIKGTIFEFFWNFMISECILPHSFCFYIYIYKCKYIYFALWDPGFITFQHELEFCPLDWRTTIHWNVVPPIFQHDHICQGCWKNAGPTFQCMVVLQSRGQGPDSCWK